MIKDIFSALGDATRLQIVEMLGHAPMAAGEIAERIPTMSRPAVVKHITILREAGVIVTEKDGRQRINMLDPAALTAIDHWLALEGDTAGSDGEEPGVEAPTTSRLFSNRPSKLLTANKTQRWR